MVSIFSSLDRNTASGDELATERSSPSLGANPLRNGTVDALGPPLPPAGQRRAIHALLNGDNHRIPAALDDVLQAAELRRAAQIVGDAGGVEVRTFCLPVTCTQFWLTGCPDSGWARRRIGAAAAEVLQASLRVAPDQRMPAGCIPALRLVEHGRGTLEALMYVERTDESCSRALRAAARAIGAQLADLAETHRAPEIEHAIVESDRVRARCHLPRRYLSRREQSRASEQASGVRRAVAAEPRFEPTAAMDRRRFAQAAAQNDQVIDGLVVAAAGARVTPGVFTEPARAHAARWGSCEPLCRWRVRGDLLLGELCMPVDLAAIGAFVPRDPSGSFRAVRDVADQVAAIGLISSVAYLRATSMAASEPER